MKNSKGETLPQPYLDLALMRRAQQIDSKWVKNFRSDFAETQRLCYAFSYRETPEMWDFWDAVDTYGQSPIIPAASLAELEEWRKAKEVPAEPADDWKAKYDEMKAERDYYRHEYELKCMELDDIDSRPIPTPTRNWVAECAMAAMQGYLSMRARSSVTPSYEEVSGEAWAYAEAWAAEGVKRRHIN